jgi:hypothetical protein
MRRSGSALRNGRTILTVLALIAGFLSAHARAEERLVAPPYPGAIRLSPEKMKGRDRVVFGSRDPHEKVQAFYQTKSAHLAKGSEGEFSGQKNTATIIVYTYEQSLRMIQKTKGDYTWANPAEVFLEWRGPNPAGSWEYRDFFGELDKQAKKFPGHDAELTALKKEYDWLQVAFAFKEKVEPVYKRCSNEAQALPPIMNDPEAMKKLQAQLEQLSREGRYKERNDLAKQLSITDEMKKKRAADHFGLWKACLTEASGFGYLTKISIHQDPSVWSY